MHFKFLRNPVHLCQIGAIAFASSIGLGVTAIYLDGTRNILPGADYAIVYGNKVEVSGVPSQRLQERLDHGLRLYRKGVVQAVMVSGGFGKEGHDEAIVMAAYLEAAGIPSEDIIVDSYGNNTHLTSVNAAELLGTDSSVIAVSQLYHLSRARLSLHNNGFTQVGSSYPTFTERRDIYSYLREVPAWLKYWVQGD